jgi:hypothetical protein
MRVSLNSLSRSNHHRDIRRQADDFATRHQTFCHSKNSLDHVRLFEDTVVQITALKLAEPLARCEAG